MIFVAFSEKLKMNFIGSFEQLESALPASFEIRSYG